MQWELYNRIEDFINKKDLQGAFEIIREEILLQTYKGYQFALNLKFNNSPAEIINGTKQFLEFCRENFVPEAIYLEMNDFSINPNPWFFDLFGYEECGDIREDLDWLSDWQSNYYPGIVLTGMEELQKKYAEDMILCREPENNLIKEAQEVCDFWVMLCFMDLIRKAVETEYEKEDIPLFCTDHDDDIIFETRI